MSLEDNASKTGSDDLLRQLRAAGVYNRDICLRLGISESELERRVRRLGLPLRVPLPRERPARLVPLPPGATTLPPLPSLQAVGAPASDETT